MKAAKLLAAGLLAVAATASMAQETAFSVKGIAPDGVGVMYLSAFGGGAADSSIVAGKGFAFEGKAQKDALLTLTDGHRGWSLFNDGTPVDVDLNRMTIKASPLNERLFAINLQLDSLNAIGMGLYADYERVAADASGAGRRRKAELLEIARICRKVPAKPAETFREAIQSFWFTHLIMFIELNGRGISPGRLGVPARRADTPRAGERQRFCGRSVPARRFRPLSGPVTVPYAPPCRFCA